MDCLRSHERSPVTVAGRSKAWTVFAHPNARRSQWLLRGLKHGLSSLTLTLGSWVRIPLKAWMSVRLFGVYVFLCLGGGLATG
jgi:hypothetical protein